MQVGGKFKIRIQFLTVSVAGAWQQSIPVPIAINLVQSNSILHFPTLLHHQLSRVPTKPSDVDKCFISFSHQKTGQEGVIAVLLFLWIRNGSRRKKSLAFSDYCHSWWAPGGGTNGQQQFVSGFWHFQQVSFNFGFTTAGCRKMEWLYVQCFFQPTRGSFPRAEFPAGNCEGR